MPTKKSSKSRFKFSQLDIFGKKFTLNFGGGSSQLKTEFGGVLTFLVIILVIPILIIFFRKWIDTSNPRVSVNNMRSTRDERYMLRDGNIFMGFMLFDGTTFPVLITQKSTLR